MAKLHILNPWNPFHALCAYKTFKSKAEAWTEWIQICVVLDEKRVCKSCIKYYDKDVVDHEMGRYSLRKEEQVEISS